MMGEAAWGEYTFTGYNANDPIHWDDNELFPCYAGKRIAVNAYGVFSSRYITTFQDASRQAKHVAIKFGVTVELEINSNYFEPVISNEDKAKIEDHYEEERLKRQGELDHKNMRKNPKYIREQKAKLAYHEWEDYLANQSKNALFVTFTEEFHADVEWYRLNVLKEEDAQF